MESDVTRQIEIISTPKTFYPEYELGKVQWIESKELPRRAWDKNIKLARQKCTDAKDMKELCGAALMLSRSIDVMKEHIFRLHRERHKRGMKDAA